MEKDKEEKKDKSNKQNFFSKIFKKKKKDEKNDKNAVDKPKDKSTYFVALTGMPDSSLPYFCAKFYLEIHEREREFFAEETHNAILKLPDRVTPTPKIEGSGSNFIEILPPEISFKIFATLEPASLFYLSLVNKKYSSVLHDPKTWQTFGQREELAPFGSITECFKTSLRPISFFRILQSMVKFVRYDVRQDSTYWRDKTDNVDYDIFVVTVNFGKFDEQDEEDKSTNYLRKSADFIAEIAQVKPGQSTSGLVRSIVVVCAGGGDLRTKLDEKNISFQQYFPEATKVIQGSVLDIIAFMESMYKARLSNESLYGQINLHIMELDSFNEYRSQFKVSHKINHEIVFRQVARDSNKTEIEY
jgi:hypothetical protein